MTEDAAHPPPEPDLTTEEVAAILRLNPQTLWKWRRNGQGPPWFRAGAGVRYPRDEFTAWRKAQTRKVS